jgi:hypothetical protein
MAEDGDWRLTHQDEYLTGLPVAWVECATLGDGWDHDHCSFCWAEFARLKTDHAPYTAGYLADGELDDYWICPACFEDFRERFGWVVQSGPADTSSSG